ncbi:aldo/keto reductase [Fontivita pretiosa]|uniref:aldo/keto reductase n=1 Tax=Fontivita pretiosa TaxID=2989684 RepID=UPI003D178C98
MQYTNLGRTGLKVSRLCLGTMNYGPHTSETEAFAQMDKALELGINFFDTADVYGWKKGEGVTEQIIGRWFAQGGGRREKVILATKVHGPMNQDPQDLVMDRGLNALKIRRACENSLKRLRTDYIDLYQMHHIWRDAPWEELWQAFELLVQQGKVVYVGSSNFGGWHIATANQEARKRNFMGLVSEQSKYSLLCRTIELEVLPACRYYGLGVIPWSPLDGGVLGGILSKQNKGRTAGEQAQKRLEKVRPQIERFEAFCRELGEEPANVALAWVLANPAITAPIIGPRTMDQLTGCLRALEIKLDEAAMKKLDEIFPGPGGPAPEAYAW